MDESLYVEKATGIYAIQHLRPVLWSGRLAFAL